MKDYFGYSGKVCVVTGASSGIGRATARLLVEMGAKVYALCRKKPDVDGLALWIPADLMDKAQIDAAFAQIPQEIDCFFGAAGTSDYKFTFTQVTTLNFIANRYITETYLVDRVRNGGRIAYVSSPICRCWDQRQDEYMALITAEGWEGMQTVADEMSKTIPNTFAYVVTKRAISYYAAASVAAFSQRDIRVNVIVPTSTRTGMMEQGVKDMGGDQVYQTYMCNGKPYAEPESMAKGLVYLNSDFADYVSGLELYMDWGFEAAIRCGQRPDDKGTPLQTMLQYGG